MSNLIEKTAVMAFALTSALALAACDVDQTEEGALPDVDVTVDEGNMPEYDVETADVEVGVDTVPVAVPDVDIEMPDEDVDAEEDPYQ